MGSLADRARDALRESESKARIEADERRDKRFAEARWKLAKHLWSLAVHGTAISTYNVTDDEARPEFERTSVPDDRPNGFSRTYIVTEDLPGRVFFYRTEERAQELCLEAVCPDCQGWYGIPLRYSLADLGRALNQSRPRDKYEHTCYVSAAKRVAAAAEWEAKMANAAPSSLLEEAAKHIRFGW